MKKQTILRGKKLTNPLTTKELINATLLADDHKNDCKSGKHKFVACDEWEPTCIYCGKFQS
jgi:hypothetical protein